MSRKPAGFWQRDMSTVQPPTRGEELRTAAEVAMEKAAPLMGGSPDEFYGPVRSAHPQDPRISSMEYYRLAKMVIVHWGDGGTDYAYYDIGPDMWRRWKKSASPGSFINRVLMGTHVYGRL